MADSADTAPADLFSSLDAPADEGAPAAAEPAAAPEPTPAPDTVVAASPNPPAADDTPAPAAAAAEPAAAPADKGGDRTVPLAVLIEERRERREEIAALRAEIEKLKAPPAATEAEPADPDYLDDPKAYTDARIARALKRLDDLEKQGTERIQQIDERTQGMELNTRLNAAQEAFVAKTPDYPDALAHVREVRAKQLQLANPNATLEQIVQHIGAEERQAAAQLIAQGRNPAEYVYRVAETLGYTRRQQAPAAAAPEARPNGVSAGTVPADVTLNRTPGNAPGPDEGGDDGEVDILAAAQAERFRRRA